MALHYLEFDYSEDSDDAGTFDAMASVGAQQLAAVHAEVVEVLAWCEDEAPGRRGPLDEGGDWDYDLQGMQEAARPEAITFDPEARRLSVQTGAPGAPRHTLTLSIVGTRAFCAAFRQRFDLAH
jgi:hypothetical protein